MFLAYQSRRAMGRRSSVSVTVCASERPSGRLISSFVTLVRRRVFPPGSVSNATEIVPEMISLAGYEVLRQGTPAYS
jgi:hypothetical protein